MVPVTDICDLLLDIQNIKCHGAQIKQSECVVLIGNQNRVKNRRWEL